MEKNKKYLVWMNCYGAWAPELRHPIETIGYNSYLNDFIEAIVPLASEVADIYISGGMYDSLDRTECETTKPELEKRFRKLGLNFLIKTDEKSVTSIDIMERFLTTWKNQYPDTIPILFVDEPRYETNCFTFEYFCQKYGINNLDAKSVIISLARLDNHPNSTLETQAEKLKLMKEKGVEYVNGLEHKDRKEYLDKKES